MLMPSDIDRTIECPEGKTEATFETDERTQLKLTPVLDRVLFDRRVASAGTTCAVTVYTACTPLGVTDLEIEVKDVNQTFYTKTVTINNWEQTVPLKIPADAEKMLMVKARLPDYGISSMASGVVKLTPPVSIWRVEWFQKTDTGNFEPVSEAVRPGHAVAVSAQVSRDANGWPGTVEVWRYDPDGSHRGMLRTKTRVEDGQVQAIWHPSFEEIREEIRLTRSKTTNDTAASSDEDESTTYDRPVYFATIRLLGASATSLPDEVELPAEPSARTFLSFKDMMEVAVRRGDHDVPPEGTTVTLLAPDESETEATVDAEGRFLVEESMPGRYEVVEMQMPEEASADDD